MRTHLTPSWFAWIGLMTVLIIAATLRVWRLDDESLWIDEVISVSLLDSPSLGVFFERRMIPDGPTILSPLYFMLEYGLSAISGQSILVLRLYSVCTNLATVLVVYLLGRKIHSHRAGLMAATCTALSISQIYYAQEIRMYSQMTFLVSASMYALLHTPEGRSRWLLLNVALNALMLFTHVFGVLVLPVQATFILMSCRLGSRRWVSWMTTHLLLVAIFAIWCWRVYPHGVNSQIPEGSLRWLLYTLCIYYPGLNPWGGRLTDGQEAWLLLPVIAIAGAAVGLFSMATKQELRPQPVTHPAHSLALLSAWFLFPPLLLFVASILGIPCFLERYALHSSLPFFLFVGIAIASIQNRMLIAGVIILVLTAYAMAHTHIARPLRLDFNTAISWLRTQLGDDDHVIGWEWAKIEPMAYYLGPDAHQFQYAPTLERVLELVRTNNELGHPSWVVLHEMPGVTDRRKPLRDMEYLFDSAAVDWSCHTFHGLLDVVVYQIPSITSDP